MKRTLAAFLLIAVLGACEAKVLQEDDPGWNCHTMGNRICGTQPDKEDI